MSDEAVPLGQRSQEIVPATLEKLPAAHGRHSGRVSPKSGPCEPIGQSEHCVRPATAENLPGVHASHSSEPALGWAVDGAHGSQ